MGGGGGGGGGGRHAESWDKIPDSRKEGGAVLSV